MSQPNRHLHDHRAPAATSPRHAVVTTLQLPEPAATLTDLCPDLPAQLEQIAADVAALWTQSDSPPTLPQALSTGEACGRLRAHAAWLRAKQHTEVRHRPDLTGEQADRLYEQLHAHAQWAAIRGGARPAGLSSLFGLIREEVHRGRPDQATDEPGPAAGSAPRARSEDRSLPPQEHTLAEERDDDQREQASQSATGGLPHQDGAAREDSADPSTAGELPAATPERRRRQVSPAGREAMRLSGRRLQERRRVARAAADKTTICPRCEQTRLIDGEHLCPGDNSNGHAPGARPARLQVIYDLGREGHTPPPWVANDPALLAVYDEGLREAHPTTEAAAATPNVGAGDRPPRRDEDKVSCPRCGRSIGTNRWGTISAHKTDDVRCDGAGTRPTEATGPAPADDPAVTRQRGGTTRRSAVQLTERQRIAAATSDELTACVNCGEPRHIDGEHTCRRGCVIESIDRPVAVPEPRTDTCTHSSTSDGITTPCRKPAGHTGVCSWVYEPKEERQPRPIADSPLAKSGGLSRDQLAEIETTLAAAQ